MTYLDDNGEPVPFQWWWRAEFTERYSSYTEEQLLAELQTIDGLPDSESEGWRFVSSWKDLARLIAASSVVGERKWRRLVVPIFERAALGIVDDQMQTIRHGPEKAFGDDSEEMAIALAPVAGHPRPGARQWSIRELGILREEVSLPILVAALDDPVEEVKEEATSSLAMLAQVSRRAQRELDRLGLTEV